jgi:hypothetical protein
MLDSNTNMSYFQLQMIVKFNKFSSTYLEFHYRKTKVLLQDYYIFKNKSLNPEHLSTSPVNYEVRVGQYLVVCVLVCPVTLDHCIVCSSSIYGFWLSHWYLQPLFWLPPFVDTITMIRMLLICKCETFLR